MAEMRRGRSQAMWRYTPGATFRYSDSGPWCQVTDLTMENQRPLEGALAEAVTANLRRWDAIGRYPDPVESPGKFVVGTPRDLRYDLWPLVFTCRRCQRLHYYQTLDNLLRFNENLSCDSCKGKDRLRQVGYGFVCECGQLDTIFAPRHDRNHPITLIDRRNFRDSYWYCTVCKTPLSRDPRAGLGFRQCTCRPGKAKRGVVLEDSRVFYSQTIDLVDIEPASLEPWRENAGFGHLLLAATLRIPEYRPSHIQDLARRSPESALSPELEAMRRMLIEQGMPGGQADAMVRQATSQTGGDAWNNYRQGLAPYRVMPGVDREWAASRNTVEYVFVRDDPATSAISLDELIAEVTERDPQTAQRLEGERALAKTIGLVNLRLVGELPILLAAIGYTRWRSSPTENDDSGSAPSDPTVLRPFPETDGKIPIFAVRNTTEALMYEIDPWRIAAFVEVNAGAQPPAAALGSEPALRSWLLGLLGSLVESGEAHFVLRPWEVAHLSVDENAALCFGVLHTLSHVLKATAHRYVGLDADALAEYLFPAHMAGLLYASSQVTFTLGGIDAVFRSNLTQWLGSARDFAGTCSFDPVCESSGGACLACLYPKFGCAYFNRTVSRAFLMGGNVAGRERPIEGFWSQRVSLLAETLRANAGA